MALAIKDANQVKKMNQAMTKSADIVSRIKQSLAVAVAVIEAVVCEAVG
jgi:hypothetical protein